MLNFAFSPEIKHKQRPFERCFFPLVYLVLQNNHALRQNTMNDNDILFNRVEYSHFFIIDSPDFYTIFQRKLALND